MPGITNPAEEYFKDGQWAWDPAGGVWLKLIIDPLTNRLVIDHPGDLEVVQPVPNDLRVGNYGWDGSAWHKLPMVWGYSGRWVDYEHASAEGAGDAVADCTPVAAGEVWVLQAVAYSHNAAAAKDLGIDLITTGHDMLLVRDYDVAPNVWQRWSGECVLAYQDFVRASAYAPGAGKSIYVRVWGYKMKVAE